MKQAWKRRKPRAKKKRAAAAYRTYRDSRYETGRYGALTTSVVVRVRRI
jgi:hypothetical protein